MKKIAITLVGVLAAGAAVTAMAGKTDSEQLTACVAGIEAIYGDDARTKLRGVKNVRSGTKMRIKTMPADGDSLMVTCVAAKDGTVALTDSDGVALTAPAYNTADKVSLND